MQRVRRASYQGTALAVPREAESWGGALQVAEKRLFGAKIGRKWRSLERRISNLQILTSAIWGSQGSFSAACLAPDHQPQRLKPAFCWLSVGTAEAVP